MKLAICAGPATTGKTAVLRHMIRKLLEEGVRPAFLKIDVQYAEEDEQFAGEFGIPTRKVYSGELCPDHCNVMVLGDAMEWARKADCSVLFVETAGLCLRCSPYVDGGLGMVVLEATSGMNLPLKVGPMLSLADVAVVTKIDRVSQAEREVFRARIQDVAPSVRIREVNALYGIGIDPLVDHIHATPDAGEHMLLRGNPPVGTCTICVGKKEVGWQSHFGVVRPLENQIFYGESDMPERIYFDNAATTPLDPRVAQAMRHWLGEQFGNASSLHWAGREAKEAVNHARQQVADLLHAVPGEIVFTASGTEADNMALFGVAEAMGTGDGHIITSAIEHPAVMETCSYLQRRGVEITYLPVGTDGIVAPEALTGALRLNTRLVSIMAANNVTGTLQPIVELGRIAREHGALFHSDAVQAVGKLPLDVQTQPIDLLSLSAHKLHGPQGVGALYVRKGIRLEPLVHGGGQEGGLRSATHNVADIVGLGQAAEIARVEMSGEAVRLVNLRDRIIEAVTALIPSAYVIGHRYRRLPGHICMGFAGQEGEAITLLLALDEAGIAVSTGSACSSNRAAEPSYVLLAMGFDPIRARGSLRVTLGRFNSEAEVERLLQVLPQAVAALRPIVTRAHAPA